MTIDTPTPNLAPDGGARTAGREGRPNRIARVELLVAAVLATVMLVLVIVEPSIVGAPFENSRTALFTVGGTVAAALAWLTMLRSGVPPVVRVVALAVPFLAVNWWLISPYFVDDVVDEDFAASIVVETPPSDAVESNPAPTDQPPTQSADSGPETTSNRQSVEVATAPPTGPVLLGAGEFIGLAGHTGTGDAGIFRNPDGSLVLRFENFDIQNGPDLEVYLVPGADQTSPADGSIALGELEGNVGDQNYELPPGTELPSGGYTVLVWCEAFSVEFVGATITV